MDIQVNADMIFDLSGNLGALEYRAAGNRDWRGVAYEENDRK